MVPQPAVAPVENARHAAALLAHPLRTRLVAMARDPASATELAARLDLPRQRVNYHVRLLARSGFLRRAGQIRKKNLIEQRYVATARAYVLAPALLGPLAAAGHLPADAFSAGRLIGLAAEAQADVSHALRESAARGLRLSTLSMSADLRFASPAQRLAFTEALQAAVTDVVGRFSASSAAPDGSPAPGRPFRLFLACYPRPPRSRLKP